MTSQTAPRPDLTSQPDLTAVVTSARNQTEGSEFLSQSRCIDSLLDCLNAAVRPTVREIVTESLAAISQVGLVTGRDFRSALDQIQMAFQVDSAFDHLELSAS